MGHGPSLLEKLQGEVIDSFDYVVRLKRCLETLKYPEVYGTKTNAVCGSWTIRDKLPSLGEKWVFLDSRHSGVLPSEVDNESRWYRMDRGLCDWWNRLYRLRRTPYKRPLGVQEFDPLGHPHLSAGFHAILYACRFLKPSKVVLAGFDNIESGSFTWSITRGPDWGKYPDHRWDIEHDLLLDIGDEFGVEVSFL